MNLLAEGLDVGMVVIDDGGNIVVASEQMATLLNTTTEQLSAWTGVDLCQLMEGMSESAPERLLATRDFPVVCEELAIPGPRRRVLRWVARRVEAPITGIVVVATDITAEIEQAAEYQKLAMTDHLTGLANRRNAEQMLKSESARARRHSTRLSFALLDIDHFKRVNDTAGHAAGDEVLTQISQVITRSIRQGDFPARWGGEEFLLIMSNTDREQARICVERIRRKIEETVVWEGQPVTVSIGIAEHEDNETIEASLARADEKLYEAKEAGRNQVCG